MKTIRIVGIVIVAIGALMLMLAYNASNAPLEQLSDAVTGSFTDRTTWYLVCGVAAVVGGGLLALFGNRA